MCNVYLHSGVLANSFIFSKPCVLGDPRNTPVNEPNWLDPGGVARWWVDPGVEVGIQLGDGCSSVGVCVLGGEGRRKHIHVL